MDVTRGVGTSSAHVEWRHTTVQYHHSIPAASRGRHVGGRHRDMDRSIGESVSVQGGPSTPEPYSSPLILHTYIQHTYIQEGSGTLQYRAAKASGLQSSTVQLTYYSQPLTSPRSPPFSVSGLHFRRPLTPNPTPAGFSQARTSQLVSHRRGRDAKTPAVGFSMASILR